MAAEAAAAAAGEGGDGSAGVEAAQASTEDVDVKLVPTPPQTPKDGSRPPSSRKVISPKTGEAGENMGKEGSENPDSAAGMLTLTECCMQFKIVVDLLSSMLLQCVLCIFACVASLLSTVCFHVV